MQAIVKGLEKAEMELTASESDRLASVVFRKVVMWVDNMAGSAPSYQDELSSICRPERVGLGAKIIPKATASSSSDPVERKLQSKVYAIKKKSAKNLRKANHFEENGVDNNDDDDEPESRIKAFTKRKKMKL